MNGNFRGRARGRGRANITTGRRAPVSLRNLHNQLRIDENGRKFTPQRTPPTIVQTPWNDVVCTIKSTSPTAVTTSVSVTSANLVALIRIQLGITNDAPIELRVSKVEAWNLGQDASIAVDVYPTITLSTTATSKITRLEDNPGKNQWACVGYIWPKSHINYVLPSDVKVPIVEIYSDIASSVIWSRFHCLWRFRVDLPPSYNVGGLLSEVDHSFDLDLSLLTLN